MAIIGIILFSAVDGKESGRPVTMLLADTIPNFHLLREFKGQTITKSNGIISLSTGLDNDYYFLDSQSRTGYFYAEARVGEFKNTTTKRFPLNIAIVLDRSGSMKGEKMRQAKQAAKSIIEKLTAEDVVSVIMYDHEVTLIQPAVKVTAKDSIYKKIDAIEERGSTNLWGGTEKGFEQVKQFYQSSAINRVLLISDGLANSGLTNARVICNKVLQWKDGEGISLSTFGVGLDYNEVLMTDMAETGAGNYYFINDPQQMSAILEKELNGLATIAAQNVKLQIRMPAGIQLLKFHAVKADTKKELIEINFRDLFSADTKGVLVQFRLLDNTAIPFVFRSTLSYTDVADNGLKILETENKLQPLKNLDSFITHYNRNVLVQMVLAQANEVMEKAMAETDKGLYEGARLTLMRNAAYLQRYEPLVRTSVELQKMTAVNNAYLAQLQQANKLNSDSLKLIQKQNRQEAYKIRVKKQ